jgi:hypothetical protein
MTPRSLQIALKVQDVDHSQDREQAHDHDAEERPGRSIRVIGAAHARLYHGVGAAARVSLRRFRGRGVAALASDGRFEAELSAWGPR